MKTGRPTACESPAEWPQRKGLGHLTRATTAAHPELGGAWAQKGSGWHSWRRGPDPQAQHACTSPELGPGHQPVGEKGALTAAQATGAPLP